jgi:hypothetical protein
MIQTVLYRNFSLVIARSDGMQWVRGDTSHGWQDKSPDVRPGHVVGGLRVLGIGAGLPAGAAIAKLNEFNTSSAIGRRFAGVDQRYDRPGRRDQCAARSHPARKPRCQTSKELCRPGYARREESRIYWQGVRARQD